METVTRKRVEIVAETALRRRIVRVLDDLGVSGYTILPVLGGRGVGGEWSREGQVSTAGEMIMVICLTDGEKAAPVVDAVLELVSIGSAGLVSVSDVEVVRGDRF